MKKKNIIKFPKITIFWGATGIGLLIFRLQMRAFDWKECNKNWIITGTGTVERPKNILFQIYTI